MPSTAGCLRAFELDGSPLVPTGERGARVPTANQVWVTNSKSLLTRGARSRTILELVLGQIYVHKIIDLPGGQINVKPLSGKHYYLLFLIATLFVSNLRTLKNFFIKLTRHRTRALTTVQFFLNKS